MRWQPIESAPKDGTEIIVRGYNYGDKSRGRHRLNAYWDGGQWRNAKDEDKILSYLTEWQPLPAPPVSA